MSRDQGLWAGHIVWAAALLTALGDALSSLLMGFACEDGDTGRHGPQGERPGARWALGLNSKWKATVLSYSDFCSRGESCCMWSLVSPCLAGCPSHDVDPPSRDGEAAQCPTDPSATVTQQG